MTSQAPQPTDPIAHLMAAFKVNTWEPVRPLAPIAPYPADSQEITNASMEEWLASKQFERVHSYFQSYPTNSLLFGYGREILYHLVRSTRAQHVVEIGTYFTGTSEVLARALWENGSGTLHTCDPYGGGYCPPLFHRLPEALLKHISFTPVFSMELFTKLSQGQIRPEILFIDGNHDYEYASFDLMCAAKLVQPKGIVVLDNIELTGPYWAIRNFLAVNPGWEEIGSSIGGFSPGNPFDEKRRYAGETYFGILKAPSGITIQDRPYTSGEFDYDFNTLSGLRLTMDAPAPKGKLHVRLWLNAFASGIPDSVDTTVVVELGGESTHTLTLDKPLKTTFSPADLDFRQHMEMALFWEPLGHREPLRLTQRPEGIP